MPSSPSLLGRAWGGENSSLVGGLAWPVASPALDKASVERDVMAHPDKSCGTCTACCRVMGVPELSKPPQQRCTHCDIGRGCKIYADRPTSCREFECGWLQASPNAMPDRLRPDRCGVVFTDLASGQGIVARCDIWHPTAWQAPHVLRFLRAAAAGGIVVFARAGTRLWAIGARGEWELPAGQIESEGVMFNISVPGDISDEIGFAVPSFR